LSSCALHPGPTPGATARRTGRNTTEADVEAVDLVYPLYVHLFLVPLSLCETTPESQTNSGTAASIAPLARSGKSHPAPIRIAPHMALRQRIDGRGGPALGCAGNRATAMEACDKLRICDLQVRARVGVTPTERHRPQDLFITVTLHADLRRAGRSDRLADSVDYKRVKQEILAEVERRSFRLIERVAERVAAISLRDPRVVRVDVRVSKPAALRFARCTEVEISRMRPGR